MLTRKERIEQLLTDELSPNELLVENESHYHHVPKDSETHFKITMMSSSFISLSRIERHRLVNKLLQAELDTGLHALSMHLYTPEEWQKLHQNVPPSPACRDGYQN